jgi:hypothetical protein
VEAGGINVARSIPFGSILFAGALALSLAACEPTADGDGDGLRDANDPCQTTPPGAAWILPGCSATDLMLRPQALGDGLFAGLDAIEAQAPAALLPPDAWQALSQARPALALALQQLREGTPCVAVAAVGDAADQIALASEALAEHAASLVVPVPESADSYSDAHPSQLEPAWWEVLAEEALHLSDQARDRADDAQAICDSGQGYQQVSGVVASIRDELRLLSLESGEQIVLGENPELPDPPGVGSQVTVSGTVYGGVALAEVVDVAASPFPFIPDGLGYDGCLHLRIAPHQQYPVGSTPWILHPLAGYEDGGVYRLEQGARIGVWGPGCPAPIPGAAPNGGKLDIRYRYALYLSYTSVWGIPRFTILSTAMKHGDAPVALPEDIDPSIAATLFAFPTKQTCTENTLTLPPDDYDCSDVQTLSGSQYALLVADEFSYCQLGYLQSVHALQDAGPSDFESNQVTSVSTSSSVPGPVTFSGVARPVVNGQVAAATPIGMFQPFAIFQQDFWMSGDIGTNRPSGLRRPHIDGDRGGQPFRYACSVPELIRDAINFCSGSTPDTFYRLPFAAGQSAYVGQGNFGSYTHNGNPGQSFAIDLDVPYGTPLRAARGGVVLRVKQDDTTRCVEGKIQYTSTPCPNYFGNHVVIKHADGSLSWYMHMQPNNAEVEWGDRVEQGALLGYVGLTGNTGAPHVHFHVTPDFSSGTMAVTYEYDMGGLQTCSVPQTDQTVISTN